MQHSRLIGYILGLLNDFRISYALLGVSGIEGRKFAGLADFLVDESKAELVRGILVEDDFTVHERWQGFSQYSPPDKDNCLFGFWEAEDQCLAGILSRAQEKPLGRISVFQPKTEDQIVACFKAVRHEKSLKSRLYLMIEELVRESRDIDAGVMAEC
ncbi:MAG: hypothetical protein PHQ23_15835, partial [Candidatus Wallbacteria bacterium]|nr:hypothetical protein [Candidatus Wallbacteria bacterium]